MAHWLDKMIGEYAHRDEELVWEVKCIRDRGLSVAELLRETEYPYHAYTFIWIAACSCTSMDERWQAFSVANMCAELAIAQIAEESDTADLMVAPSALSAISALAKGIRDRNLESPQRALEVGPLFDSLGGLLREVERAFTLLKRLQSPMPKLSEDCKLNSSQRKTWELRTRRAREHHRRRFPLAMAEIASRAEGLLGRLWYFQMPDSPAVSCSLGNEALTQLEPDGDRGIVFKGSRDNFATT